MPLVCRDTPFPTRFTHLAGLLKDQVAAAGDEGQGAADKEDVVSVGGDADTTEQVADAAPALTDDDDDDGFGTFETAADGDANVDVEGGKAGDQVEEQSEEQTPVAELSGDNGAGSDDEWGDFETPGEENVAAAASVAEPQADTAGGFGAFAAFGGDSTDTVSDATADASSTASASWGAFGAAQPPVPSESADTANNTDGQEDGGEGDDGFDDDDDGFDDDDEGFGDLRSAAEEKNSQAPPAAVRAPAQPPTTTARTTTAKITCTVGWLALDEKQLREKASSVFASTFTPLEQAVAAPMSVTSATQLEK